MKSNQSLHLTIKQPPNPEPVKTLGVFTDLGNPAVVSVVHHYINNTPFDPKSEEFKGNVKDEVIKLLSSSTPIAVAKEGKLTVVYFEENK